jgi:hypothetical protein
VRLLAELLAQLLQLQTQRRAHGSNSMAAAVKAGYAMPYSQLGATRHDTSVLHLLGTVAAALT